MTNSKGMSEMSTATYENEPEEKVVDFFDLEIDPEFAGLMPPLTAAERQTLKDRIAIDGCIDPITVWKGKIIDGHNRYEICNELGIPFRLHKTYFDNRAEAMQWMYEHQQGRRNWTPERERYVRGQVYNTKTKAGGKAKAEIAEEIAEQAGVSVRTVYRDASYAGNMNAIGEVVPELKTTILSGEVEASANDLAELAQASAKTQRKVAARVKDEEPESLGEVMPRASKKRNKPALASTEAIGHVQNEVGKLIRAVDSLNESVPSPNHPKAIALIRELAGLVKSWQKN
jgi:hypothetical protein